MITSLESDIKWIRLVTWENIRKERLLSVFTSHLPIISFWFSRVPRICVRDLSRDSLALYVLNAANFTEHLLYLNHSHFR